MGDEGEGELAMNEAERLAREELEARLRRDASAASAPISPDAVWRFPGPRNALFGTHEGREAIFGFLMKVAGLTGGSFQMGPREIVANDRVVYLGIQG
jgi:ketosteroid isomerase-like protein